MALDPEDLEVETFTTTDPSRTITIGMGGMSEPPAICSCFGTCDMFCDGGGTL